MTDELSDAGAPRCYAWTGTDYCDLPPEHSGEHQRTDFPVVELDRSAERLAFSKRHAIAEERWAVWARQCDADERLKFAFQAGVHLGLIAAAGGRA